MIAGLKWRYRLYVKPRLLLDRGLMSFCRRQFSNCAEARRSRPCVYISADATNIGDYVSSLGIQQLVGRKGVELFCSPAALSETFFHLRRLAARRPDTAIIVGGGGLLQECFAEFWERLLSQPLPFMLFGVGANDMPGRRALPATSLLARLAHTARGIHVRDGYTRNLLSEHTDRPLYAGVCPSVNYLHRCYPPPPQPPGDGRHLLHLCHATDIEMAGGDNRAIMHMLKSSAEAQHLQYAESNHIRQNLNKLVALYTKAALIVTSRLHGAIFSIGLGKPFIGIRTDRKMSHFVDTYAPWMPVLPPVFTQSELDRAVQQVRTGCRLVQLQPLVRANEEAMTEMLRSLQS